jgi:hypothetical protein
MHPWIGLKISATTLMLSFEQRSEEENNVETDFFKFQWNEKIYLVIHALLVDEYIDWIKNQST